MPPIRARGAAGVASDLAKFGQLKQFIADNGRLPHRDECAKDGTKIGRWVATLRAARSNTKVRRPELAKMLDELPGWKWNISLQDRWQKNYEALQAYCLEHNELPDLHATFRGLNIGIWARDQRQRYKRGNLPEGRVELLSSLPRWKWPARRDDARDEMPQNCSDDSLGETSQNCSDSGRDEWHTAYEILQNYCHVNDALPAPNAVIRDVDIGEWVGIQRRSRRQRKLPEDRAELLEQLPPWRWHSTHEEHWYDMYNLLLDFHRKHGRLPAKREAYEGVNLGVWVATQRYECKNLGTSDLQVKRAAILSVHEWWSWGQSREDESHD